MDKEWFDDNHDNVENLLSQLHIDSAEDFEEFQRQLFIKLDSKPILTGEEFLKLPSVPNNFIVDKLFWHEDVALLLASEKVGKSIFSMQLACAMTCGENFLGEYLVSGKYKVLYIQAEGSRSESQKWFKRMLKQVSWDPKNFYHMFPSALSLDTDTGRDDLISKIYETGFKPDIIIIDPLYMAMEGDLIDNKAARLFCRNIRVIKTKFDCSILLNHHKRRPVKDKKGSVIDSGDNDIMGSFVWKAFPSHVLNLAKRPDGIRTLTCETQRGGNVVKDMRLDLVGKEDSDPLYFKIHGSVDHGPSIDVVFDAFKRLKKPMSNEDVQRVTDLSPSSVNKAFSYLTGVGVNKLEKVNPGGKPTYYKLVKKKGKKL